MREKFRSHFPSTVEGIKDSWQRALFVFDTNTLLNLYRYSESSRENFIGVLTEMKDSIWVPHQAAKEFFGNRLEEISNQESAYDSAIKQIEALNESLTKDRGHPFISMKLMKKLGSTLDEVVAELRINKEALSLMSQTDRVLISLSDIFSGRVGEPLEAEIYKKLFEEGAARYSDSIPPGFKDAKKHQNPKSQSELESVYGDLVIWKQTLVEAKRLGRPVIFITDDTKDDWWLTVRGKTIGPRPELISEFWNEVGQEFHMYRPEQFLTFAKEHLGSKVRQETIEEVKERKSADQIALNDIAGEVSSREMDNYLRAVKHFRSYEPAREAISAALHGSMDTRSADIKPSNWIVVSQLDRATGAMKNCQARKSSCSEEIGSIESLLISLRMHGMESGPQAKELEERLTYLNQDLDNIKTEESYLADKIRILSGGIAR